MYEQKERKKLEEKRGIRERPAWTFQCLSSCLKSDCIAEAQRFYVLDRDISSPCVDFMIFCTCSVHLRFYIILAQTGLILLFSAL